MTITYSPVITCYEEQGTAKEDYAIDAPISCSVTRRCAWADRKLLVEDLLLNARPWPYGTWTTPPVAVSAGIAWGGEAQLTQDGQGSTYADALVTVGYSTQITDLISEELEPTAEFLKLDYRRFRWGSVTGPPILEAEAGGVIMRGMNIVRTIFDVGATLPTYLLTYPGTSNNAPYTSVLLGGLTFGTETLMFNPPKLTRMIKSDGSASFNMALKTTFKAAGWNKFYRSETNTWEYQYDVTSGIFKPYPPADYSVFLY